MNRNRVDFGIDREGPRVFLAMRQAGRRVTLDVTSPAAASLAANLVAACNGDEDVTLDFQLTGSLSVKEPAR